MSQGGNIDWILENFKDGNTPSEFDLKFEMGNFVDKTKNGTTTWIRGDKTITIKINQSTLSEKTVLEVAKTILHEAIHADYLNLLKEKEAIKQIFLEYMILRDAMKIGHTSRWQTIIEKRLPKG